MKLIPNWREVLLKSFSMWFTYIGVLILLGPEALYALGGIEVNPYSLGWSDLGAAVLVILGRVIDQGMSGGDKPAKSGTGPAAMIALAALFLVSAPSAPMASTVAQAAFVAEAVPLVSKWEGKRNQAYLDVVGVPTICYGHTRTITAADVAAGVTWSDARCEALLRDELVEYREGLHRYFTEITLTERLTPKRDAAYTSLAFNVGIRGAGRSTATRRLNAGDIAGGCEALTWWNKAGGRVWRGLVRRRSEERAMCLEGL